MQKRLTALFVLASALLVTVPVQAHTSKAHAKPVHAKHAQQKQAHVGRAHTKHSKLAAATHKAIRRHHHQTHLTATTRIANIGIPTAIDADELTPDTALTLSGSQYLTAHSTDVTNAVPAWLDHAPAFNSAQMMVQSDAPTYFGKLAAVVGDNTDTRKANSDLADANQRVSAAIGSGDTAAVRQALIAMAMQLRDIRYVRGGHDPSTGFDCSGFVRYVFAHAIGMQLPTNSASQFLAGLRVKRADMKPGDLVFFHTHGKRRISHVGIYISDGRFIHSPTTGKSVQISSLDEAYWAKHFAGAKRPQAIAMAARG
jgi:cell wall-associated NlpC family hydrolase